VMIDVEHAEWDSLLRWKKRSGSFVLVGSVAEAVVWLARSPARVGGDRARER
jgi:hypothetical protein